MTASIDEAQRFLRIARSDLRAYEILASHPDSDLGPTCFHAHQAIEKSLKAVLILRKLDFPRTHDLEELAQSVLDLSINTPIAPRDYRRLNPFAVAFRYDDQIVALLTREDAGRFARQTVAWAESIINDRR